MKLAELLIMTCCSIIAAQSAETAETEQEALLKRASEQLERLAPYRRTAGRKESDLASLLEIWRSPTDRNGLDADGATATRSDGADRSSPWEILEILPDETKSSGGTTAKRIDDDDGGDEDGNGDGGNDDEREKRITIDIVADPRYAAIMQERIKRGLNVGYANLLTGIAGGVVTGVASASSSSAAKASTGSSSGDAGYGYGKPAYGSTHPVYAYEEKQPFGPWDFKQAIFSTLAQALKAIGGGVLALKGQLVKGSGYLLAAKSNVIVKTGDVITSFGKQLASSVVHPKPYSPDVYTYDQHPPIQHIEHDPSYQGPPPSLDDYSEANDYSPHSAHGVPSDDSDQGGLLIVTPTRSDLDGHGGQPANVAQESPDLTKLGENFGGPTTGSFIKDLFSSVPIGSSPNGGDGSSTHQAIGQANNDSGGGGGGGDVNNISNNVEPYPPLQHPTPTYGAPDHYAPDHGNPAQNYESYPPYPPDNAYAHRPEPPQITSSQHHLPSLPVADLPIQPAAPYPPLHPQPIEYPAGLHGGIGSIGVGGVGVGGVGGVGGGGSLASPLLHALGSKLPLAHTLGSKLPDDDGASVYASISVDTEPQLAPVKTPFLGYPGAFDLPKLQPHAQFHGQPFYGGGLDGPLRLQLLNSLPAHGFWPGQGPLAPAFALGALNPFRKRNAPHQRRTSSVKRLARRSSSLHRL